MSLIKAIKAQLGLSGTATNNFTLDASAADGTMKLARGNAGATTQDILTVDVNGKVAFPQMVQTWQNMEASRALGTVYTNTTDQPITINVSAISTLQTLMTATVGGVVLQGADNGITNGRGSIMAVVPAGATYRADMSGTTSSITWKELR